MLLQDLRLALRGLRRAPGFALVAILTLGLGIGANAAIYSVLDAALLRPLPFREPDRLVTLHLLAREQPGGVPDLFPWSYPKYELFRRTATSFEGVAGYNSMNLNLVTPEGPERLEAEGVGGAYFGVLGLRPHLGRFFVPAEDERPGEPAIAVLAHALWSRRFGADSGVIGREVRFNGRALAVVGVAPPGFRGLSGSADLFVPITMASVYEYSDILTEAGNHWFSVVARLKPGVSLAAADADATQAGAVVDRQYHFPSQAADWSATARALADSRTDPGFRQSVWLLAGAVGLVLLIACVNLTSLLLVRMVGRRREVAVRLALGAARSQLVRQVMTESLVLALAGWVIALGLARAGVGFLARLTPGGPSLFDPASLAVGARVAVFGLLVAVVAALLTGLVPAVQAAAPGVRESLHAARAVPGRNRVLHGLVVAEVALALVLLVGAGLLMRSLNRLAGLDVGFRPDHLLTFRYAAADGDLAGRDPRAFKQAATERLANIPGIEAASIGLCAPLASRCSGSVVVRLDDQQFKVGAGAVPVGLYSATPDHFKTLGIPILRGRAFTAQDRAGAPRVVVINENAARRLFPGKDPLGHRISAASGYFAGGDSTAEIVGVARDVRYGAIEADLQPDLYYPAYQSGFGGSGTVFLRTRGDPFAVLGPVRAELRALDPTLPIFSVMTMEQRAGQALARPRFAATLLGVFAAVAMGLAGLGLYGVLAFSVAQRTREIGLRMALGADGARVIRDVIRQGVTLAGMGIVVGLGGALALQRLIAGMLYGVTATDPVTFGATAVVMAVVALAAAWIPARRATRVDPLVAIREDQ